MTKLRLMLLLHFHLGLDVRNKEQIQEAVDVMNVAHEIDPFESKEDVTSFVTQLFFPDGAPKELAPMLERAGVKWMYFFFSKVKGK